MFVKYTAISCFVFSVILFAECVNAAVVAYYEFNDSSFDSSAILVTDSGPHGLIGIAGSSGGANLPIHRAGLHEGWSLEYFGTATAQSFVEVPDPGSSPLDLTGPLTIEAFIRPNQSRDQVIVRKYGGLGGNDGGAGGYALDLRSSGQLAFVLFDDDFTLSSNTLLQTGTRYHVAATWDGTIMRLYINHQLDAAMVYNGNLLPNDSSLGIGAILRNNGTEGQGFAGRIDAVRIHDQELQPNDFLQYQDLKLGSTGFAVSKGSIDSGGLADLQTSNDQYLIFDPSFIAFRYQLCFTADCVSPIPAPGALEFSIESHTFNIVGVVERTVEVFNYDSGQFVQVDARNTPSSDTVIVSLPTGNPAQFVEDGTGNMRARFRYENAFAFWVVSFFNIYVPYETRVDQIGWSIIPSAD